MFTKFPTDIKLYIFSFLDYELCFQTLMNNYKLYFIYMRNMFPYKYEKKIINGYYFNDKNKCFYCYGNLDKQYMINMCPTCNLNHTINYDFIKVCDTCINIRQIQTLNKFNVYTKNKKLKTTIFNYFKCKICEKKCIHLQLSKHTI
jgi:hypothetical protein